MRVTSTSRSACDDDRPGADHGWRPRPVPHGTLGTIRGDPARIAAASGRLGYAVGRVKPREASAAIARLVKS